MPHAAHAEHGPPHHHRPRAQDVKDSKDAGLEPGRGSGYNKILGAAQDSLFAARSQFKRIFGGGQEGEAAEGAFTSWLLARQARMTGTAAAAAQ